MPQSDRILKRIIDMRLPLTFLFKDCALVAIIISQEVARGYKKGQVRGACDKNKWQRLDKPSEVCIN